MGTKEYGRKELERIGYFKEGDDPYNVGVANAILELLEVFDNQMHSNCTAPYTAGMFHRLAMFKPITPLTGEDDEWTEVGPGVFQNKRYSAVFKNENVNNGKAYNIEGRVFSDDGGETWFTNRNSRVYIDFPYTIPEHPEKIILKDDNDHCDYKSQKKEMTDEEAGRHLEFMIKSYQNLIDNDIRSGEAVGKDVEGQWSSDTTLREAYQTMIDALNIALSWQP